MSFRKQTQATALLCFAAAVAVADDKKPEPAVPVESPLGQLRLAVTDLATNVRVEDAPFTRYLSFYTAGYELQELPTKFGGLRAVTFQPGRLAAFRRGFRWWFNHTSAAKAYVREVEVDGPRGTVLRSDYATLVRIDIRDAPNWTRTGWIVVADRDYLFREPLLPNRETVFGRLVTGIEVNPETFSAGFILNAYQLFRDTFDATRQQSYYDLLYAAERHPDKDAGKKFVAVDKTPELTLDDFKKERPWPGGVWPLDGRTYPKGAFTYFPGDDEARRLYTDYLREQILKKTGELQDKLGMNLKLKTGEAIPKVALSVKDANGGVKNFPEKGIDFEKRWGTDVDKKDIEKFLVDPSFGGIAAGRLSDPVNGSYVALQDRAIRITTSKLVAGGWGARTFDVLVNIEGRDHIEKFREIALGQAEADAGELLATLPNGSQAGLLVNGQDARVEVAASEVAQIFNEKIDPHYRDVRTPQGCVACHSANDGFNSFRDQFKESIEKGLKFKFLKEQDAQKARDFYLSWEKQQKIFRVLYADFTAETTRGPDGKSWTGQETWEHLRDFRDWYDAPVTIETVATEFGVPVETLRQTLLGRNKKDSPIEARINQLTVGKGIPRRTWDLEVAFKMILFLDTLKPKEEPIKVLVAEELLQDAIKRFGHGVRK